VSHYYVEPDEVLDAVGKGKQWDFKAQSKM